MEFYSLNKYLREQFDEKVTKLSIDGGFTCPNRDGTIGDRGCIFCSEEGSGEFAGDKNQSVTQQMECQIDFLSPKWKNTKYIAYFQSFTNTYGSLEKLKALYDEALSFPNTVGLAIATRADCLSQPVIDLLKAYSERVLVWVEIGVQSIHKKSEVFVRRGYELDVFIDCLERLKVAGIKTVAHIIVGLPSETLDETQESIEFLCKAGVWGLKLHMLYVSKNTDLARLYEREPFYLLSVDEYIDFLRKVLSRLPSSVVIHRLTGDCKKSMLIAPWWILNKRYILNSIRKS